MAKQLWYPGAVKMQQADNGLYTGGPPKGLLHSTEVPFGEGWATFKPGTYSHLEVIGRPSSKMVVCRQYYPLNQPSRALQDGPLAVRTNRDGVIQIELGFRAARVGDVPDWFWVGVAEVLRWIEDVAGVNSAHWAVFKAYPSSFGSKNGVRFSAAQWDAFDGFCGHMHVPDGNEHGDPGLIPVEKLRRPPPVAVPVFHTIQPGETVLSIARKFKITPLKLWRLNQPFKAGVKIRVK